jgi:DNA (cytosine-5)-methyltransferase 1
MTDVELTPATRDISAIMRKVHSTDTSPELAFRSALDERGIHYLATAGDLPGKPDIIMPEQQVAIFIDGDYWHGNQWRKRGLTRLEDQFEDTAQQSRAYWLKKIRRNMERDCAATAELLSLGWTVLRFWESDIHENLARCIEITCDALEKGAQPSRYALAPFRTFAEFFAGIGLMRMGLERHGWSIAFANDMDERKYQMYSSQFPNAALHWSPEDVHKLPPAKVPAVSLATASFPCTDLSLAGGREGLAGEQSKAFWGFATVLDGMEEQKRPPLILLENVPAFLTSHKGTDFHQALRKLNKLQYKVDAFILDAARFVPQSRQRLFVVGVLEEDAAGLRQAGELTIDPSQVVESDVRPKALVKYIKSHDDIRWNIRNLPSQPTDTQRLTDILEDLPDDAPEWWSAKRAEYLLSQMSPRHREIADRMIAGPAWSYGTVFRRMRNKKSTAELRADGIAGCLRTPKGGSAKQILFKAGQGQYFARLITPREAARLMGADEYNITVPLDQALLGFGDAVCVPVVEWIARYYFNPVVSELIRGRALRLPLRERGDTPR